MRVVASDRDPLSERRSFPTLIAWLSLCMLSAGWGPHLDPSVRQLWTITGSFGLSAAVGLSVIRQARCALRRRLDQKTTQRRVERNLVRLVKQNATFHQIREALSRIIRDCDPGDSSTADRCSAPRMPFLRPVRVRTLNGEGHNGNHSDAAAIKAFMQDLSASGVGLIHNRPIDASQVTLTFDLLDGETISFVATQSWCSPQADGKYHSGWKLMDVVTLAKVRPQEPRSRPHEAKVRPQEVVQMS